jgi:lipopolysaccharide biosynthesis protein
VIVYVRIVRQLLAGRRLPSSVFRALQILRTEGLSGIRVRTRFVMRRMKSAAKQARGNEVANRLSIVPLYLGSLRETKTAQGDLRALRVAVHLHLFYHEMLPELALYLQKIPIRFDLFVSVPAGLQVEVVAAELRQTIPTAGGIVVETVPNRGRDIAPFIIQFGSRLLDYNVIGHFHSKRSPHDARLKRWRDDILELLLGPKDSDDSHVLRIVGLLESGAKVVYPEGQNIYIKDKSGWSGNFAQSSRILHTYLSLSIFDYPEIDFPEGSMFWARSDCISEFLRLPLRYEEFPEEPIAADGTLAHALERLILVMASPHSGPCIRLHKGDSIKDYRFYEEQQDFSDLVSGRPRVLSYYLPQFHAIPENDLWHGPGFTEWTKVRAATPLFQGHYQQHIPHLDIGYYTLTGPDVLARQADMMRKSGVYGQVFYHYWFSGKLILEKPAKMLLENADIDMPFCFCWANENWTRAWDGNENDVLLRQTYSPDDARAFIRYLIPFFADVRHLTIEGRPLLFVYRPSNIPNISEYLEIWEAECRASGLPKPFVVAVLTRGAVDPNEYGMDAGVERVLHDWTGGNVSDITDELVPYRALEGARVLPYAEVARYYRQSTDKKRFSYFRSLVPQWDNSARYGAAGYMLHGSTPQDFQDWLEDAIQYTRETLPEDRQLILINAWNEWAEGAHLEPDSRFGYSYLNSVGRALSGTRYVDTLNRTSSIPASKRFRLRLTRSLAIELQSNASMRAAFRSSLSASTVFGQLVAEDDVASVLGVPVCQRDVTEKDDLELEFRKAVVFDREMIEKMIALGLATKSSIILANAYGQSEELVSATANGSTHSYSVYDAPVAVFRAHLGPDGLKNVRVRTDAHCVVDQRDDDGDLPAVTTIVRFHNGADFGALQRALLCLAAMKGCKVTPLVAAQDLSSEQSLQLEELLRTVPWAPGIEPQVRLFSSENGGDLRSAMLNKSLQQVTTRYAAFLDFDDRLMPHAYDWLLSRLKETRKAIAIGRVFDTLYDLKSEVLISRNRNFQYGYSYDDFLKANIAPLHSVMLDLSQLNVADLKFFEDQRFLEDYLMLLQLIRRDNVDWEGLAQDRYIGDYIFYSDGRNTLAIADKIRNAANRNTEEFSLCERRVRELKSALKH